ncbi:MAG: carboxynorspermidine decarboxylase [Clostridiales bacterium]|nr:carboxynorspermidine decarboxylase [Clostridiales bacterium]
MQDPLVFEHIPTPAFVVDMPALRRNAAILKDVSDRSGAHILLAQKAFSCYRTYPELSKYLSGTTASGYHEARLGYEEMGRPFGKETHVYAPAFTSDDMDKLLPICDHIIFNSVVQWKAHRDRVLSSSKSTVASDSSSDAGSDSPSFGLRCNPEYSEIETDIYNPCVKGSRLGILRGLIDRELFSNSSGPENSGAEDAVGSSKVGPVTEEIWNRSVFSGISGLHFHTHCEQGFGPLSRTIKVIEEKFGDILLLPQITWLNLGGGHHITKEDYDREGLIREVKRLAEKYNVTVYLEPGEAVAIDAGYLVGTVLDIVENGMKIAILDVSAACHMPDVLEMPYRPPLRDSGEAGEKPFTYRLAGNTCLAGDVIGDYSFDHELSIGERLYFLDMAMYTMVKDNTFNGMPLPSIWLLEEDGNATCVKSFGYEDFKCRL